MTLEMADLERAFLLVGRFVDFLPGEKSPYQMISLEVSSDVHDATAHKSIATDSLAGGRSALSETISYQITLGKSLRRMMYRYLEPQDWIRVVGDRAMNLRSGQIEWRAAEIFKLSACQVADYQSSACRLPAVVPAAKALSPVRVLVCQASDCRQRGSEAVSRALKAAILEKGNTASAQSEGSQQVTVQSTGCMKRCKEGPNVVVVPGGRHSRVSPKDAVSLLKTIL